MMSRVFLKSIAIMDAGSGVLGCNSEKQEKERANILFALGDTLNLKAA